VIQGQTVRLAENIVAKEPRNSYHEDGRFTVNAADCKSFQIRLPFPRRFKENAKYDVISCQGERHCSMWR
jgi:hypothetical protein